MSNIVIKNCKHHGETDFVIRTDGYSRCKKCVVIAVQKRRDNVKQKAVDYLGGECSRCGYSKCVKALEFHHPDPSIKGFGIAHRGKTRSWEKVKLELDKCILLCANCHREEHSEC